MAQWGLGETRYLKARKSTGSDLEEALSPISTTITSTSNDTNATRSPRDRRRVPLTDLTTSTLSSRSSLFEPAHAVLEASAVAVGPPTSAGRAVGRAGVGRCRFAGRPSSLALDAGEGAAGSSRLAPHDLHVSRNGKLMKPHCFPGAPMAPVEGDETALNEARAIERRKKLAKKAQKDTGEGA